MGKDIWKPGTVIYPVPAVMVSCGTMEQKNIITVAWTGTVNSDPAMTYVSIRPSRHSYNIIKETGEFVINLVTERLVYACDFCGVRSGRDLDKFEAMHLTAKKGENAIFADGTHTVTVTATGYTQTVTFEINVKNGEIAVKKSYPGIIDILLVGMLGL